MTMICAFFDVFIFKEVNMSILKAAVYLERLCSAQLSSLSSSNYIVIVYGMLFNVHLHFENQ